MTRQARGEYGLETVVILLRDRIELVIVTAGALEGQAQKRRAGGVYRVGEPLILELASFQGILSDLRSEGVKARAHSRFQVLDSWGGTP